MDKILIGVVLILAVNSVQDVPVMKGGYGFSIGDLSGTL